MKLTLKHVSVLISLLVSGCGGTTQDTYGDLINEGWGFFSQAQYDSAYSRFTEARDLDPSKTEAYTGRGWSRMKLDDLVSAASEFNIGSGKSGSSADLHAGWAFGLNAQKDYNGSNGHADQAISIDPNWTFSHGLLFTTDHLHVLKAENYFALGNFSASLNEVKILNPGFNANVTLSSGQFALSAEIERLKSTL